MFAIPYIAPDPVLLSLGPLEIKWYGLSYVLGIILAWFYCHHLIKRQATTITRPEIDDMIPWVTVGVVAGGKIGYGLFYNTMHYLTHPWEFLMIWKPGMSFHGGLIGVLLAIFLFTRKRGIKFSVMTDLLACATPIGLFFGRLANYINHELYGRVSDVPWAMIFPYGGPLPRHPSQLYEAALEGIVLFIILYLVATKYSRQNRPNGYLSALFAIGYGTARSFVEFYREPDAHLGYYLEIFTWGQILSLPLILGGLAALFILKNKQKA